jgi:nucleoside-diphosphate-sugar epimerase
VGDVRDSLADISLARDLIGYDPKVPFPEGLAKTSDWLRSTPAPGCSYSRSGERAIGESS